jgi:hypothetical protein
MSIDRNWQKSDSNDELALLNEELMLLTAHRTLDETTSIENSQASQGHKEKITGNTNKYKLLSSVAIIIASAALFTPDYAFAEVQYFAAKNVHLKQQLIEAQKESDGKKAIADSQATISFTGGKTLKLDNIVTVKDMSLLVPNLSVTSSNIRQARIELLGLG